MKNMQKTTKNHQRRKYQSHLQKNLETKSLLRALENLKALSKNKFLKKSKKKKKKMNIMMKNLTKDFFKICKKLMKKFKNKDLFRTFSNALEAIKKLFS